MLELSRINVGEVTVVVAASERSDGDMHPLLVDPRVLAERQRAATARRWAMLDQVHGVDSVELPMGPSPERVAGRGDVIVASGSEPALAIWAADCAPVVLVGDQGTRVAVHAGWRGLASGVLDVGVDAVRDGGEGVRQAVLGPVVRPCCYEFDETDAAAVAAGVGVPAAEVTATIDATNRLDVPAAVAAALARRGVRLDVSGPCTGCDERWFSHRVRGERERHAVVTWTESTADG